MQANKKALFEELTPVLFSSDVYSFIRDYYFKYHTFPTHEVIEEESGVSLPYVDGEFEYYLTKIKNQHIHAQLMDINNICSPYLQQGNYDPSIALDKLLAHILEVKKSKPDSSIDFAHSKDILIETMNAVATGEQQLYKFGYDWLDELTNGFSGGDLVSIVARLNIGKTFFMLHVANYLWNTYKIPILFLSLEMPAKRIAQRLVALNTDINLNKILQGALDKKDWKQFNDLMKRLSNKTCPFKIHHDFRVPVESVYAKAQSFGAQIVFVDGAYLLRINKYLAKTERYALVAEELKGYSLGLNVPVITSWQLNREADKKKEISASNIYYSDDIAQLSSVVIALSPNTDLDKDFRRKVQVLKSRDGRLGENLINWSISDGIDFSTFDQSVLKLGDYF
jgi:replicative DNA helicase